MLVKACEINLLSIAPECCTHISLDLFLSLLNNSRLFFKLTWFISLSSQREFYQSSTEIFLGLPLFYIYFFPIHFSANPVPGGSLTEWTGYLTTIPVSFVINSRGATTRMFNSRLIGYARKTKPNNLFLYSSFHSQAYQISCLCNRILCRLLETCRYTTRFLLL